MASGAVPAPRTSIPFYRDTRIIAVMIQIAFAILVLGGLYWLYRNMMDGLARANLLPTFRFLNVPAGFPIGESPIAYDPSMSYGRAFVVGVLNTIRISILAIVMTTVLGIVVGVMRLSSNWLLSQVAAVYVEIMRNVPLLLHLLFWYLLTKEFPAVKQSIQFGDVLFLHNRGASLAWPIGTDTTNTWLLSVAVVLAAALGYYGWQRYQFLRRDRPGIAWPAAFAIAVAGIVATFFVIDAALGAAPLVLETPELSGFNFKGGATVTTSFLALFIGLVIYTSGYVAETVRSGIISVNKGQREAALALGLTQGQTLQLVIMPQALRLIIPPMTSTYLSITKNSSLAVAIGYPDLFYVANTINNQTGQAVPVILMVMASYLSLSLLTSLFMNWYNKRIQLVER
jgi:general L-amino acid transport system permease protein